MTLHSWSSYLCLPILHGLQACATTQGSPCLHLKNNVFLFLEYRGMARLFLCRVQTQEMCALISGSLGWKTPDGLLMWLVTSFECWLPTAILSLSFLFMALWPAQQSGSMQGRQSFCGSCLYSNCHTPLYSVYQQAARPAQIDEGLWLGVVVSHYKVIDSH